MKQHPWLAIFALTAAGLTASPASSQKAAPEQNVTVTVLNAQAEPPQPVKAVRVSLSYLGSGLRITDAQQVTNSQGEALLLVSAGVAEGADLRIEVAGATDLAIYEPADGQLPALASALRVSLLPKGSLALRGPAQIEALLRRTLLQVSTLQKQNQTLKQQVASAQSQEDIGAVFAEWARANGFSSAEVDDQIQQWARGIQSASAHATLQQKALAEFALRHYARAAQLFNQAGDADSDALDADAAFEKSVLDRERTHLQQLIKDRQQSASASQLNLQYHQATQTLETAEATASAEFKKHPDDQGFHELWLQALSALAQKRSQESMVSPASESVPLARQAVSDLESVVGEYTLIGDPMGMASSERNLGDALDQAGIRIGGDEAVALLERAAQAFQSALNVYTRAAAPKQWAATMDDLGNVLHEQAKRAGNRSIALYEQSARYYREALNVYTQADTPSQWAHTQEGLSAALGDEGRMSTADKAVPLLHEAEEAIQNALKVYTKDGNPWEWASAEMDLGADLGNLGIRARGDDAAQFQGKALEAYNRALEVYTRDALPQDWASVESDIGIALSYKGVATTGTKALSLLDQSVRAFRSVLEVYTKADLPQDWARTQAHLGDTLYAEAGRSTGDSSVAFLDQSVAAYDSSLEVYTQAAFPRPWAWAQSHKGSVLVDESMRVGGQRSADLLARGVQSLRDSLAVYTLANSAQGYASVQAALGQALLRESMAYAGDRGIALADEAAQAEQNALQVFTRAASPLEWAQMEHYLGDARLSEGERSDGGKAPPLLDEAIQSYSQALQVFTKTDHPEEWFEMELSLMEATLAASRFSSCAQIDAKPPDAGTPSPLLAVRDAMMLACQWGAGEKDAAVATKKFLLSNTGSLSASNWDFTGLAQALSNAPAFAPRRASWIALFTAVQNGDGAAMTAALHQLEPVLQQ
jgi:hypothetical protein